MAKRLFDVVVAALGLVVAAPVLVVAAVGIRLSSRGPILHRARLVGRDGRLFTMYKLRTMVRGAEFTGAGLAIQEGDDRITRIGRFLRRYSLDELPNLWNVVRGEIGTLVEVANRVRVRVGPVTAEVTAASAERLELARGGRVYATFKATGTRLVPL